MLLLALATMTNYRICTGEHIRIVVDIQGVPLETDYFHIFVVVLNDRKAFLKKVV